jgi:4-phospho-D-threonate 3-dehydrogenase / 4-phospho-D-erythronate 3-dehydrogenase
MKNVIGITMGDPAGIGPEIILKAFMDDKIKTLPVVVIGSFDVMEKVMKTIGVTGVMLNRIERVEDADFHLAVLNVLDVKNIDIEVLEPGKVQAMSGNAAFEYVKIATELAMNGEISAVATAPLNKEAMHLAGHNFPGHTEILGHYTNTKDFAMLLFDDLLKVIHVSTHISLKQAIETLNKDRIASVIQIAQDTMKLVGYENVKIGVAGINPHAGEGGLFGDEEIKEIIPAIERKKAEGINVEGPVPPDTIFLRAKEGEYDVVVAMYHDQGHIPLKLLGFHSGVNVTAGLPIIRTSVDHGTAFDRAWKGISNPSSMIQAILLAHKLSLR